MADASWCADKVLEKWAAGGCVFDMQFSPDGKHLVAATGKGLFEIDPVNGKKQDSKPLNRLVIADELILRAVLQA
jgi:hypothetical protein